MHDLDLLAYIEPVSGTIILQLVAAVILGGIGSCLKPLRALFSAARRCLGGRESWNPEAGGAGGHDRSAPP